MTEQETIILLRKVLQDRLPHTLGFVLRYQPTQEGRTEVPTIYLNVVRNRRYGWRGVSEQWDDALGRLRTREAQPMETTLRFSCQQLPTTDSDTLEASDVLNIVAGALQSDGIIQDLRPHGQVQRVTDLQLTYITNDAGRFEPSPFFDVVLNHMVVYEDSVPQITHFEFDSKFVPDII